MTTAAMVVGMIPLILAAGAGAQSRFAIGIVIAAGMSIGTIFTLFVTPAIYTLIARDRSRGKPLMQHPHPLFPVNFRSVERPAADESAARSAGMPMSGLDPKSARHWTGPGT